MAGSRKRPNDNSDRGKPSKEPRNSSGSASRGTRNQNNSRNTRASVPPTRARQRRPRSAARQSSSEDVLYTLNEESVLLDNYDEDDFVASVVGTIASIEGEPRNTVPNLLTTDEQEQSSTENTLSPETSFYNLNTNNTNANATTDDHGTSDNENVCLHQRASGDESICAICCDVLTDSPVDLLVRVVDHGLFREERYVRTTSSGEYVDVDFDVDVDVDELDVLTSDSDISVQGMVDEELDLLPTIKYDEKTLSSGCDDSNCSKDKCSICLEAFLNGDDIRVLSCFHRFHAKCADVWLRKRGICPVCRENAIGSVNSNVSLF